MSDQSDIGGMDENSLLVAEYALGLLTAAEHAALGARLKSDVALRADLAFWRTRLSSLDSEFAETAAPAAVLAAVERRVFGIEAKTGFWNSLSLWRSLAGAAALVAAIAVGLNLTTPRVDPNFVASQLVAAIQAEGSNVSFVALYNPASGSVRLVSLSGDAVPEKDYELWAIEGANAPISMGVVPINAKAEVKIPAAAMTGFGAGTILAITLEQKGGSPTGAPQGPLVAKGAATQI